MKPNLLKYFYAWVCMGFLLLAFPVDSNAQSNPCNTTTFTDTVDLRGNPDASWTITAFSRGGTCSCQNNCHVFVVYLDSMAAGIKLTSPGANAWGAGGVYINCGHSTALSFPGFGNPICPPSFTTPFFISMCKPGNNDYDLTITSIKKANAGGDILVKEGGCSAQLVAEGFIDTSITWTAIGDPSYNQYLSCTADCDTTIVTYSNGAPPYVDYVVCGIPEGGCGGTTTVCDTARVFFASELLLEIQPDTPTVCFGSVTAELTANFTGGRAPFKYLWQMYDSASGVWNPIDTAQTISVGVGTYTVRLTDATDCGPVYDTVVVTDYPSPILAMAGNDSFTCANAPWQLHGRVQSALNGRWIGGNGTFFPGRDSLNAMYSPTAAEIFAGQVTLSLATTFNGSCPPDTDDVTFFITPPPVPQLTGDTLACQNNSGYLYTTALNGGNTYTWSVTNGTISVGPDSSSKIVTWGNAGTGILRVTETNNLGCSNTDSILVTINPKPTAIISGDTTTCQFSTGNIYSTNSTGNTYNWTVTGGVITSGSGTESIVVTWGGPGNGIVTLEESNSFNCDTTVSFNITINERPVPVITGDTIVCRNTANSIYSTPYDIGSTYLWTVTGGDITSTDDSNVVVVTWLHNGTGTISVKQTNSLGCDTTVSNNNIIINERPVPVITGDTIVCRNTANSIYSTPYDIGSTYLWTVTGGTITSVDDSNVVVVTWLHNGTGTISVKQTNSLGCDTTVSNNNIIINERPVPVITGDTIVCRNTANSVYSTPYDSTSTYLWTVTGGDITSTDDSNVVVVTWLHNGTGTISVKQTNSLGCDTTVSNNNIIINERPVPVITGDTIVCRNTANSVYSTPYDIGSTYLWTVTGGDITSTDDSNVVVVTWLHNGIGAISITQTNSLGCDTTVSNNNIIINERPVPAIAGDTIVCRNTANSIYSTPYDSNSSYLWTVTGGDITSTDDSNVVVVTWLHNGIGAISITQTNSLGCDTTVSNNNIIINERPVPAIAGDTIVCRNTANSIYSTPYDSNSSYLWTVTGGDITSTDDSNVVVVTWLHNGTGTISVKQTNSLGCDTTVSNNNIIINERPVPVITGDTIVCRNTANSVYSTPYDIGSTYLWTVTGGDITSTDDSNVVVVTWLHNGTGTISVKQTNSLGCDTTVSNNNIIINERPVPVITGDTIVCRNTANSIYSTPYDIGSTYLWTVTGGDITSTDDSNVVVVTWLHNGTGTISVKQTNSLGCDTTVSNNNIIINERPVPVITGDTIVCRNTANSVYSTPYDIGSTYLWTVTGGDITSTDDSNVVVVTWLHNGTGTISVKQTNSLGCDTTVSNNNIIINERPVPVITGDTIVCRNTANSVYSTPYDIGSTYLWTVTGGDITSTDDSNVVVVTWLHNGTGTISVKQTNSLGCDTTVSNNNIIINERPVPVITGDTIVCRNTANSIYSTPYDIGSTYLWTVTSGTITSVDDSNVVVVTWLHNGIGAISITQTNSLGCDTTVSNNNIIINERPVPVIAGDTIVCRNTANSIYSTPYDIGSTYLWTVTSGTITSVDDSNVVVVTWLHNGIGAISITQTNSLGCDTTVSNNNIIINERPVPVITGDTIVCRNTANSVYSTAYDIGSTYLWTVTGGDITSTDDSNVVVVTWLHNGTGTISVKQTNSLGCDTTVSNNNIIINERPVPVIAGDTIVCRNTANSVYSTPYDIGSTYLWTVTGGTITFTDDSNVVVVTWLHNGTGTISVKQTNSLDCDTTVSNNNIIINERPVPVIAGDTIVCRNTANSVYSTAYDIGSTYLWSVTGGTITSVDDSNVVVVTWLHNGIGAISITQTNSLGCDTTVSNNNIIINERPVPVITGDTIVCRNTANSIYSTPYDIGSTYLWTVTGGDITSTDDSNVVVVTWLHNGTGTISVKQTNSLGCDTTVSNNNIIINERPVPVITGDTIVCRNTANSVYSTPYDIGSTYLWTVTGGDITSTDDSNVVVVTWLHNGTGTISVKQTNSLGCDTTVSNNNIIINERPVPVITGDTVVCRNTANSVYSTPYDIGSTYLWTVTGGDITSTDDSNVVVVTWLHNGTGTISVKQTNSLGCDTTVSNNNIIINERPVPVITGDTIVCRNTANSIYSTPYDIGSTYLWTVTSGTITSVDDSNVVVVTWLHNGIGAISITQTNSLGCDTTVSNNNIIINERPVPAIAGDTIVCRNTANSIYSTPYDSNSSYLWTVTGGDITSTDDSNVVVVTWLHNGIGAISITQTNSLGCDTTVSNNNIIINERPVPAIAGDTIVCRNTANSIYSTPYDSNSSYLWTVTGGDITSTDDSNVVVVTWLHNGTGTISVKQTNSLGCDTTVSNNNIIINERPVPVITGDTIVCRNTANSVYSTPYDSNSSYLWTVTGGDITSTDDSNVVVVTWLHNGTGTISVKQTNSLGCDTTVSNNNIIINERPVPVITGDTIVCRNTANSVYSTTYDIGSTYLWSVTGGTITSVDDSNVVVVTWLHNGTGMISVKQTNSLGCDTTVSNNNIIINERPVPVIAGDTIVCRNTANSVYSTPYDSNSSYLWTVTGGTITSVDDSNVVVVTWLRNGIGAISITQTNSLGCDTTVSNNNIIINERPVPVITGDTIVCRNTANSIYSTPYDSNSTYLWTVTGGTITSVDDSSVVVVTWLHNGTGAISVKQTNSLGCDTTVSNNNIIINERPVPVIAGDTIVCRNTANSIYSTPYDIGSTYLWTVTGGDITSTDDSNVVVVTWLHNGTGTISVKQRNSLGCDTTVSNNNIIINERPVPVITGDTIVCRNTANSVYSTPYDSNSSYLWTVTGGDITSTDDSNVVVVTWLHNGTGTISVKQTNSLGCDTTVSNNNIIINERPVPVITGDTIVCRNTANSVYSTTYDIGSTYLWSVTGGTITSVDDSNVVVVTWLHNGTGMISVKQTNSLGCDTTVSNNNIIINERPVPVIAGDTIVCRNTANSVYSTPYDSNSSYLWTVTGGTITSVDDSNVVVVTWLRNGIGAISITQTNSLGCDTTVSNNNIIINERPVPVITGDTIVCRNTANSIYSTPYDSNSTYLWTVTGGTITSVDDSSVVVVTWLHNGTGAISVKQTNSLGCDTTVSNNNIIINERPVPVIAGDTIVCRNTANSIYSTPYDIGSTYLWTVTGGDITSTDDSNVVVVTWLHNGTGTISVKQRNSLGCDTTVSNNNIIINERPVPVITGDTIVCRNTANSIYSTPYDIGSTYLWTVTGGDITSTDDSNVVVVTWLHNGIGAISITQTNSLGCDTTVSNNNIIINERPVPVITGDTIVCRNTANSVYSTPYDIGSTYLWSVTGGTITSVDDSNVVVVTWLHNGTGTISVKQTNSLGCDTTVSNNNIIINERPGPVITGDTIVCRNTANSIYSTPYDSNSTYLWTVTGGTITSVDDSSVVVVTWLHNGTGAISVKQTNSLGCDTTVSNNNIIINERPVPVIAGDTIVCRNTANSIYSTPYDIGSTYLWTVTGGDITSTDDSNVVVVTWLHNGTGTISVKQTHSLGCDTTVSNNNIIINERPVPVITGDTIVCRNTANSIYSTPYDIGSTYLWTVTGGDITSTDDSNVVVVTWLHNGTGTISVKQTNSLGCDTTVSNNNIIINERPVPVITGDTIVCRNTANSVYSTPYDIGSTYLWTVTGGDITSTDDSNVVVVTWLHNGTGTISVKQTNSLGCDTTVSNNNIIINERPVPVITGDTIVCRNTANSVYSTPYDIGSTYLWTVTGGDITSTDDSNVVVVTWLHNGTGTISVKQTNSLGCDTTVSNNNIIINERPVPVITGDTIVCRNTANSIYSTPYDIGSTYLWTVTSGTITSVDDSNVVVVTWLHNGIGAISITQTNSLGCDTTVSNNNIIINERPVPVIAGDTIVCRNTANSIYSTPYDIGSTYLWTVTSGTITSVDDSNVVVVTWLHNGIGAISITQTNSLGCDTTVSNNNIIINERPVPVITGDTIVCRNTANSVYSTAYDIGSTYLWTVTGGDITSTDDSNVVVVTWLHNGTGTISVKQTNSLGCDTTVSNNNIIINERPVPVIAGDTIVCRNTANSVYSTPYDIGSTYLWTVTGGTITFTDDSNVVVVTWLHNGTGTISVKQTNSLDCDTTVSNNNIIINERPVPVIAGDTIVCRNTANSVYSTAYDIGSTYLWSVTGGTITSVDDSNVVVVTWLHNGIGAISITQTNSLGCDTTVSNNNIIINERPVPVITGDTIVCRNTANSIYSTPYDIGSTYLWTVTGGDITSTDDSNVVVVTWLHNGTGTISVKQTNSLGCDTTVSNNNIIINERPVPVITGDTIVCRNTANSVYSTPYDIGSTYLWTVTGGDITSTDDSNVVVVTWLHNGTGTISVKQTNSLGCDTTVSNNNIIINERPVPVITGDTVVCRNTANSVYSTPYDIGSTYLWTVTGGDITSTDDSNVVVVTWLHNGTGTISVKQTNSLGCDTTVSNNNIIINERPVPVITGDTIVCRNTANSIYSTPYDIGSTYLWTVTSGTITSVDDSNVVVVTWLHNGIGAISITQTNSLGCDTTVSNNNIIINERPVPAIAGDTIVCRNTANSIYSTPYDSNSSYLWTVTGGDITSTDDSNVVVVTWLHNGIGAISITQTNSLGCDTTVSNNNIIINERPVPAIAGDTIVCRNTANSIYSTPYDSNSSYLWTVTGGDITSTDDSNVVVVTWLHNGTGTISVKQTNSLGCDTTVSNNNIIINERPVPVITGDTIVCRNTANSVYSTPYDSNSSYLWTVTGGDITSTDDSNVVVVTWLHNGTGTISVKQTNSLGCDTTVSNNNIIINERPVPVITGDTIVCRNTANSVYSTTYDIGSTYLWSVTGGTITSVDDSNVVVVTWLHNGTGMISVKQTNSLGCDTTVSNNNIIINERPVPVIAGDTIVCRNTANSVYSTPYDSNSSYLWTVTGGTITSVDDSNVVVVTWLRNGIGAISITQTNSLGCDTTVSNNNIIINERPVPVITGDTIVCRNTANSIYSTPYDSNSTYLWTVTGGTITSVDDSSVVVVTWLHNGTGAISVKQTNSLGCDTTVSNNNIIINERPVPVIAGDTIVCRNTANSIYSTPYDIGSTYLWTVTGGDITSTDDSNVVVVTWLHNGTGTISVKQRNSLGCDTTVSNNNIIINERPVPVITGDTIVCRNTANSIYSTPYDIGSTYLWTVTGGDITSTDDSNVVVVTWLHNGIGAISVKQTNSLGCDTTVSNNNIIINERPEPVIAGDTIVCRNTANSIYSTPYDIGSTYLWTVTGGDITSTDDSNVVVVTWLHNGTGTISVKQRNSLGCDTTVSNNNIIINERPVPVITGDTIVCRNTANSIYSTPYDIGSTYLWTVTGGDITSTDDSNVVVVTWLHNGIGAISVKQTNSLGCDTTVSNNNIIINERPVPVITGDTIVCRNTANSIYSTPYDIGSTYLWTVTGGDITSTDDSNVVVVTWLHNGIGAISITQTNSLGCDTTVSNNNIIINERPVPVITGDTIVCRNTANSVYSTPYDIGSTYLWSVTGGTITFVDDSNVVVVTWLHNGTGTISVKQTNSLGCDTTVSNNNIIINERPVPVIAGDTIVCRNTANSIYSTPYDSNSSYLWTVTGGTITSVDDSNVVVVTWLHNGIGTVSVKQTNSLGCDTTVSNNNIIINERPVPVITGDTIVCRNTANSVYSTPYDIGSTYLWTVTGGDITSTDDSNVVVVTWLHNGTGTISVKQTNSLGCDTTVSNNNITINKRPVPVITGDTIVCRNTANSIYSTPYDIGSTYLWTVTGGDITSTDDSNVVVVTWLHNGIGAISITQTNSLGCDTTVSNNNIIINERPVPVITGDTIVCRNTANSIYSTPYDSNSTYLWTVTGGTITSVDDSSVVVVTWLHNGTGTISVKQTNSLGCDTTVSNNNIIINERPVPVITGDTIVCRNTANSVYSTTYDIGSTYLWSVTGGTITSVDDSNVVVVTWLHNGTGMISVKQTNSLGCDTTVSNNNIIINERPVPVIAGDTIVCRNTANSVYSTPYDSNSSYLWTVTGGTITSVDDSNVVVVTWLRNGIGAISITQTNSLGCDTTVSNNNIIINERPVPVITGDTIVCRNTANSIYSTPYDSNSSYLWTVTGGTITSVDDSNVVVVTWLRNGIGAISITQTNSLGCDTTVSNNNIIINERPVPVITGDTIVCRNTANSVYSTPYDIGSTYLWTVTGGTITSVDDSNVVVVTWLHNGTGAISITQTNSLGCDTTVSNNNIIINERPVPVIAGDTIVCRNTANSVYSTPYAIGSSYLWTVSGGTITSTDDSNVVVVTWLHNGTGTISVKQTNSLGCDTTVSNNNIIINERPVPVITGDTIVCRNTEGNFYSTAANAGSTYSWTVTGGDILNGNGTNTIEVKWLHNGIGSVTLKQENSADCDTTVSLDNIIINERPAPVLTGDTSVCKHSSANLYQTDSISGHKYLWSVVGGVIDSGQQTHKVWVRWLGTGTGTVAVKETNLAGCDTTVIVSNILINPRPTPVLVGDTSVCRNSTNNYYSTNLVAGSSYEWEVVGGIIDSGQNTNGIWVRWFHASKGSVRVKETNSSDCDSFAEAENIFINPRPAPALTGDTSVCRNTSGHIYSTPAVLGNKYFWSVNGGIITSGQNTNAVTVTWLHNGTGSISITETNEFDCDSTLEVNNIFIKVRPAPSISGNDVVCKNLPGNVYTTTPHAGSKYLWTVSGGVIIGKADSSVVNVTWTNSVSGKIFITETNSFGCDTTIEKTVNIKETPSPSLSGIFEMCENEKGFTYTTQSNSDFTYNWNVQGGAIVSGINTNSIVVNWGKSQPASIVLTVSNSLGCDSIISQPILLKQKPMPQVFGSKIVCEFSDTLTYSGGLNPNPGMKYKWTVYGGTIASSDTLHTIKVKWKSTGHGIIFLKMTNSLGCDSTVMDSILINPKPAIALKGDKNVCAYTKFQSYSTTENAGYTYSWKITRGTIVTSNNTHEIGVQWFDAGTGKVVLTVTNATTGCQSKDSFIISIKDAPTPVISGPVFHCETFFTGIYSTKNNMGNKYSWAVIGGKILSGNGTNSIKVLWEVPGFGEVAVTETSPTGCDSTVKYLVEVGKLSLNIITPDVISCAPVRVEFDAEGNDGVILYDWDFGDGFKTKMKTSKVSHLYFAAGTYNVKLIVYTADGCTDTATSIVNIFTKPEANFDFTHTAKSPKITILEDTVLFANKSVGGTKYFWDFGDGVTDSSENPQHVYTKVGTYIVKLVTISGGGCKDSIEKEIVVTAEIRIFIPNAITPDGDGINDGFSVVTYNITEFEVIIFNRWGEILFRSFDKNFVWDAQFKGQTVQQDVYPYLILGKGVTGEAVKRYGGIHVLR